MSDSSASLPSISVVICSHNPRADYLRRTLGGLKAQTLPIDRWEMVIVDNASDDPIAPGIDLSWHPRGSCVQESALGLTHARVRGARETIAPVVVFVDDDNILAPDYLDKALEIGEEYPFLGAWGGKIVGVYEVPPPDFCLRYAHMLAIRDVPRDYWSNTREDFNAVPCGAGMCIRRAVVDRWLQDLAARPEALKLGRAGSSLGACEDGHLALMSGELGLGTGVFRRLSLQHLIPPKRMTRDYFVRLAAGHAYSFNVLRRLLGQPLRKDRKSWSERLFECYRAWHMPRVDQEIQRAMTRARAESVRDLAGLDNPPRDAA
jgi:glycosyltransferase involved in cell wall biosynthesis